MEVFQFSNILDDSFVNILERIEPKLVFCDADAVEHVLKAKSAGSAKIFIVSGVLNGFDGIESIMMETGSENEFSYVS